MNNKCQLIGYLGHDLEIKNINEKSKVINFSLAVDNSYKNDKKEKISDTIWIKCTAWNKTAEILSKFCKKGSYIGLSGKLMNENYKKGDINIMNTFLNVDEILLLDKNNS